GLELFTDPSFKPYFFVICNDLSKTKAKLEKSFFGENRISITGIKTEPKANEKNVLKLSFKSTRDLIAARSELREWGELERREYDIPFTKRYLTDSALQPLSELKIQFTEQNGSKIIQKIKKTESTEIPKLKLAAFDLETYSPGRFSDPTKDPILMISLADRKKTLIFSTKKQWSTKKNARIFETEKEMIQGFFQEVQKKELDVLITYNGDSFDFPYIKDRAKTLGLKAPLGYNQSEPVLKRKGLENAAKLKGIQHLDAFQLVRLLSRFGVISLVKFDLESVVESLFGTEKNKLKANDINRIWDTEKGLEELFQYNLEDAAFTLKIVEQYWPLLVEFCRLIRFSLFDLCRTSASQAVEALLLIKSHETNTLAPNKPSEGTIKQRLMSSFIGGYVKEPVPGLHENIAVLDFRSLHPSIMIAHNISPDSLKCDHTACKKGKNISPDKDWFCEKKEGFLVSIVRELLKHRSQIKKQFKKLDKKDSQYQLLFARQWALKILLNSFYGTLGFARFRWYSRESARAITAWSRHYIREVIHQSEKEGFIPIYSDTDSNFLKIPKDKTKEDVKKFLKKVNDSLPESMELEIDGFYKRGIFVTKKEGTGGAAKKRYALIDYKDQLKIVGFEYVRRDWSSIAKETQKKVIEAVLKEGNPEKAVQITQKAIKALLTGTVPKKQLVVLTQIQRPLDKYEITGPHVEASKKAIARGKQLGVGSVIGYIITKNGKSISDKAELEEFVKEGNYDADYYIGHQVLPAVIKILQELGYSKQDLIHGGKQSNLFSFK
ncbi:DNA-directed DNA polymerase, partial [Candidatus Micrarchaeota archaeon]|nr:DNA-directed DNA polymerase [Candidatus Micrarchaeota archaeon]